MLELYIKTAIAVVIIISVSRFMGEIMLRIKQPRVVGEMIAGVVLGPTLFGTIAPNLSATIFSKDIIPMLFVLGNFGLSIYMFLIGMEIEHNNDSKSLRSASYLSATAIVFPLLSIIPIVYAFHDKLIGDVHITEPQLIIFLGTSLAITAFPMLARILEEKKIIRTKLGELLLLSASIQDVISWILLSFIVSLTKYQKLIYGFYSLFGCILFIYFVKILIRPILKKISDNTSRNNSLSQNSFAILVVILIICSVITDKIGLYSVFGGFILGLFIPKNPVLTNSIKERLSDMMIVFFLPIFFAYSGLNTNLRQVVSSDYLVPCLLIISCGILFKTIPVFFTMRLMNYNKEVSLATAGLMNARGLMELIIANIGISYNIINLQTYSILVLLAIVSTGMAAPIYEFSISKKKISI